jgi:transcriptional regulator with GAF, ATPase, and Fis domain
VNCAALPENLVESELFGHEKGAFTGALARKTGKFEFAHGGTLFLDEVGELPAWAQPKLLRALQDKTVVRLGGHEDIPVDVRLIAATNRQLEDELAQGAFRQDLYYRLKVVELRCPPLRERKTDIPVLAQHFVDRYAKALAKPVNAISPAAMQQLYRHDWPGNIRELENVIAQAIALATTSVLRPEDIRLPTDAANAPSQVATRPPGSTPFHTLLELCGLSKTDLANNGFARLMDRCERLCLQSMLARTRNQKQAADALGLSPSKLHRLIKKHGLKSFKNEFQN